MILAFYPLDFSPVYTDELCALRDGELFERVDGVTLWAVSGDSVYAHRAFAVAYDPPFPLLSDSDRSVAREYGVCYHDLEGHRSVPERAIVPVDADRQVRYTWRAEDPNEGPDLEPVLRAVRRLDGVDDLALRDALVPLPDESAPVDEPRDPDADGT